MSQEQKAESQEVAIKVENVSKDFKLAHERGTTLKSHFVSLLKGKKNRTFETQHALKDISFEVKKGEFFGIVGRNGSGKSTLLKLLAGIYQPTKGSIRVVGKLVPFIELGVGFSPELTGRENVYLNGALLGFSEKEIDEQYNDIVEFAELKQFMDQKLKNYSSGMQVRLAFSMAVRAKADVLLIDEVLAVGDADFQRKCFEYFKKLKKDKITVVFVSHDMNAVREYCDRAVLIENSKVIIEGPPNEVATEYTRLFNDNEDNSKQDTVDKKRWGDNTVKYTKVKLDSSKLAGEEKLVINLIAKANKKIERPIFGFSVKDSTGFYILGTNTQIKGQKIDQLQAGETVDLKWEIPNVFNDGQYYIDLAIVYKGGPQISDWWENASSFKVIKEDRTPYIINPKVSFKINVIK